MGKLSRDKGKRYERALTRLMKVVTEEANHVITETKDGLVGDVEVPLRSWSQEGGNAGGDVATTIRIQAKHRASPSPWKAQDEADASVVSPSDIPVSFCRRNGGETIVTMRPAAFVAMLTVLQRFLGERDLEGWWAQMLVLAGEACKSEGV